MKNYYEILEVDKNASQEVIEKAYKTLAKKYHPDLHQGEKRQEYAEKMKIINQAYDVLSDSAKREQYNQQFENDKQQNQTISMEQQQRIMRENYELKQQIYKMNTNKNVVDEGSIGNMSRVFSEQINEARRQAYQDAYIQDMKNRGYKIRYKHDFKYYLKLIGVLIVIALIFFIVYQIPFVKNYFNNLYNENILFKAIVDIFRNTFSSTF